MNLKERDVITVEDNIIRSESGFILDEQGFNNSILPFLNSNNIVPQQIMQFAVILPFMLGFPSGATLSYVAKADEALWYHFSLLDYPEPIHVGAIPIKTGECDEFIETPIRRYRTRVEMSYVSSEPFLEEIDTTRKTIAFEMLIARLNTILMSYLVVTKQFDIHLINRKILEPVILFRAINPNGWVYKASLFILHNNIHYKKTVVTQPVYAQIAQHSYTIYEKLNPFVLSEVQSMEARRYFSNGFYREAVIFVQIGIETFLTSLLEKLLVCEDYKPFEIAGMIEELPFMKMVKTSFTNRIGGQWDVKNVGSSIGQWYMHTYMLRNKVTHEGYFPHYGETQTALAKAMQFQKSVIENLWSQKDKYPSVVRYFIPQGMSSPFE